MRDTLCEIVREVLDGVDIENCKDFLDAGLESMAVMSIVSMIEEQFSVEIDPEDIVAEYFLNLDTLEDLVNKYIA